MTNIKKDIDKVWRLGRTMDRAMKGRWAGPPSPVYSVAWEVDNIDFKARGLKLAIEEELKK